MEQSVPVHVRRERTQELTEIAERNRTEFERSLAGQQVEVLVERVSADGVGRGWTSEYIDARLPGLSQGDVGKIVALRFGICG